MTPAVRPRASTRRLWGGNAPSFGRGCFSLSLPSKQLVRDAVHDDVDAHNTSVSESAAIVLRGGAARSPARSKELAGHAPVLI
jgi:hypothetical protein